MNNRIVLVTGGNKGIGAALCRKFAEAGLTVVLTARNTAEGRKTQEQLLGEGFNVDFHRLDVTEEDSVSETAAYLQQKYGKLDILVNNAGILPDEAEQGITVPLQTVRDVFETNTLGPLRLSQTMIPLLAKSGDGRIINISSGLGELSDMTGGYPAYRISKTALNAVTRILASELQGRNIRVDSVCPGWVRTDMGGPNADRSPEEATENIVALALRQQDFPTSQFLRDGVPIPW